MRKEGEGPLSRSHIRHFQIERYADGRTMLVWRERESGLFKGDLSLIRWASDRASDRFYTPLPPVYLVTAHAAHVSGA